MTRRRAPSIVTVACPRCGRSVATLSRPIHSSEATAAKWRGLCASCATDADRAQLMHDMRADVERRLGAPRPLAESVDDTLAQLRRP